MKDCSTMTVDDVKIQDSIETWIVNK
jgi:hypothetical protein